jgi:hypothetical protein
MLLNLEVTRSKRPASLDIAVFTARHFRGDRRPVTTTPMWLDPAIQPSRSSLQPQRHSQDQLCVPAMDLKGDSYRLKDRDLGRVPAATTDEQ